MSDDYAAQSVDEFVRSGTMLALPLCFPGQTQPPPAGEVAASSLAIDSDDTVYLGTRGGRAHVLAAMLRQDTGMVYDAGVVPGATAVAAMAVLGAHLYFVATGPEGAALWRTGRIAARFMIQEWEIVRPPLEKIASLPVGEVACAASSRDGGSLWLVDAATGGLFQIETASGKVLDRQDTGGESRVGRALCRDAQDRVWGTSGRANLWVHRPGAKLEVLPRTIPCSAGREQHTQVSAWARDPVTDRLYGGTTPDGFLFELDPATGAMVSLGKPTRQEPVACLTVGNDGCVFGIAGGDDDIGHLFRYDPADRSLVDLGIPVSTLSTRQYGYRFACAATGRDGEMYFGQAERVSHLWVYFPPVPRRRI